LKALAGNPGKRPLPVEPQAPEGIPDAPEWLSPPALDEWRRLVPILVGMGVLTLADGNALAMYCEAFALYVAAAREVAASGVLVDSYRGGVAKNPAIQVARDAADQCARWGAKLGLSPVDRARLAVAPPDQSSGVDDVYALLSGGGP